MCDAAVVTCSPAAAVPVRAKIPDPIIAPMPRQVRSNAVSERFIKRSGADASLIKWSGFLVLKRWEAICLRSCQQGLLEVNSKFQCRSCATDRWIEQSLARCKNNVGAAE